MSAVVEYSERKPELKYIDSIIHRSIAKYFENRWDINIFFNEKEFSDFVRGGSVLDFACVDFSKSSTVGIGEQLRENNRDAIILALADKSVPPTNYIKPGIMPSSLLLFPLEQERVSAVIDELFRSAKSKISNSNEDYFIVNYKYEQEYIPMERICYFESRDKKIFCNTANREYAFYDTIDDLAKRLPDNFVRCHRSFLINTSKILKVSLSNNFIQLEGGITVPLSKSCKHAIKELNLVAV